MFKGVREKQTVIYNQKNLDSVKRTLFGWVLFIPTFLLLYFIILRPMATGFFYSFFKMNGYEAGEFVGFGNYISILSNSTFLKTLLNTIKYVLWSLIIGFPLPIITAILLNELVHCKNVFKTFLYMPTVVPAVAVYMIWKQLYQPGDAGVLNMLLTQIGLPASEWMQNPSITILLLIIASTWQTFGSTTIMYLAALQGINQDMYEAATIDGAGLWHKFRYILLPEIYGFALLFGVKQIIGVFQIIELPMAMTGGGPDNASMSLGLMMYNYGFTNFKFDKAFAMGVVIFCILIVMTFVYFILDKKLSEGE